MPISGVDPALTFARVGLMRLGGSRLGYLKPVPLFTLNGVSNGRLRVAGLSIQDLLNGIPNTATMRMSGVTPVAGQEIRIGLAELDAPHLVFGGHIVTATQIYEAENPANIAYDLQATSYEMRLNGRRVTKTYPSQSATTTLIDLITTYTTGFSTAGINAVLPTIPEITFVDTAVRDAIDQIMERVGGDWQVDYGEVVYAFLTSTETSNTITDADDHGASAIVKSVDLSQVRTRITVRGGGSRTTAAVGAGYVTLPIEDATLFAAAGGTAFHGTAEFTYTGKVAGGVGSNVEGMAGPGSAPVAAIGTGVGGVLGNVSYKVAFKNAQGVTLPGPASNTVTGVAVAAPGGGLNAAVASGIGLLDGGYSYRATFVTAGGETTPSGATATVNPAAVAAPAAPSAASGGFGRLEGDYRYKVTLVTPNGETLASTASAIENAAPVAAPGALTTAEVSSTIGVLIGAFNYKVTFVTTHGETLPGTNAARTVSAQSAPGAPNPGTHLTAGPLNGAYKYKVAFVSALGETVGTETGTENPTVTTSDAPTVSGSGTGLTIAYATTYVHPIFGESALSARTIDADKGTNPVVSVNGLPSGCGWNLYTTGTVTAGTGGTAPLFKIAELGIGTTSFTHTNQVGSEIDTIVAAMGKRIPLTSIATGPTGTLARRIYRTKAGGSTFYLCAELSDNSTTTFTDNIPDESLTAAAPVHNPNGKQIALSSVPTGATGTLARRIYRTKAGGSQYFLLTELPDNSTTTFTDNTPDDSLTASAPLVATAGGEKHTVTIPTGPSGTLARRIYRTDAGGSVYKQLVEIANNVDTSYSDDNPDSALGGGEPLVSTAGGQNVDVTGIPTGPATTLARRLYRTKAGGSEYFLLDTIPGNATTTYTDSKADSELGDLVPSVNTAGASVVDLTSIPLGGAGITERLLFRTKGGGSDYFLLARIGDNVTTVYTDDEEDDRLHDLAPTVSTIGALEGDTSLQIASAVGFPTFGWVRADSQLVHYTGLSGTTLTGILSAPGVSGFAAAVRAGAPVLLEPHLTGIPNSGAGSLQQALLDGEDVRILVRLNDTTAQAALAAALGTGDGIVEEPFDDSAMSVTEATDFAEAQLALLKDPLVTVRYTTRDLTAKAGRLVTFNLAGDTNIVGTFLIQSVTIQDFSSDGRYRPLRVVEAGSRHFSFPAMLRLSRAA